MSMNLYLSPVNTAATLTASVAGDVLTLNGEDFDFGPLGEGETLPSDAVGSDWITGTITRTKGLITLTLLSPYTGRGTQDQRFPAPLLPCPDGAVPFPQPTAESLLASADDSSSTDA